MLERFPSLEADDVRSTAMGQSGSDLQLSPAAFKLFPYDVECKAIAKFAGYKFLEQRKEPKGTPIAVVKGNRKDPIVLIDLDHFLDLVKDANGNRRK